ncbi:MAG: LPXTG cell wall anchor domain-containing protein [Clostridia bacterium]|nr:LPXTG cell wall anchor domain-containing protein [Clostridia bacterium]
MKNKLISSFLIIFVLLSICGINNIYADTAICEFDPNVPSIVEPGKELIIPIFLKNITEGISGVGFTFNYKDSLFDFESVTAESGWTVSRIENSYTILTETLESTTNAGKIATIVLKAKSTIKTTTTETVTFTAIETSKDDATTVNLNSISKNISIQVSNNGETEEDNNNENTIDDGTRNDNNKENTTDGETRNDNNKENTTDDETTNNNDNENTTNGGTKNNNDNKNTTKDEGKTEGKIPQTGEEKIIIFAAIAGCVAVGIATFVFYKKTK